MPTSSTFKVIYLGQLSGGNIIDPTEGTSTSRDVDAENAGNLVGRTFDQLSNASVQTWSAGNFASNDGGGLPTRFETYNQDNSRGNDTFNITDANGNTTLHTYDAGVQYRAVITYGDGSTANVLLNVVQDTAGNTYVVPPSIYTPDAALLGADPIRSIQLTGLVQNSYNGLYYQREDIPDIVTVCFAAGTLIRTDKGEVAVETLRIGDQVETRDRGLQPVRWVGSRHLTRDDLQAAPQLRPILISRGALGEGAPQQDLRVSPQHRILARSRIAQRMFDTNEVLVAAKTLVMLDGVDIDHAAEGVTYVHIMFDRHEVIFSNGAETESFFPGPQALRSIDKRALDELLTLFPELAEGAVPLAVRPILSGRKARKLTMRHHQNGKALQLQ